MSNDETETPGKLPEAPPPGEASSVEVDPASTPSASVGPSIGQADAPPPADAPLAAEPTPAALELKDQLLRVAAEFDNFRKRAKRELEVARRFAIEELLKDLLPVLDAVDRALGFARGGEEPFAQGLRLIGQQAEEVLGRHGVKSFASVGQPFDPARHEAFGMRPVPGVQPGIVIEEHQKGYLLHDRLLRAAKVVVSAQAAGEASASNEGGVS